ncbi:DUF2726 domain-containing protein [Aliihoeflea sp. 40Bstr573]|uniref:DUF2726 domain-containing protein n=1 Tax=Aliihoeflea sp. 40Bstr573 TaxID=2696467 RepID=UPI0020961C11|nr:DUF2726 domain-containing protein [Aliihoeflea sp. 40Bstr573]MCO6388547.1 DUF2726 domain-containing protein [Aliihoeflea sp. 40Bstr573]
MLEYVYLFFNEHATLAAALGLAAIAGAMVEKLRADHMRQKWRSHNQSKWNKERGINSPSWPPLQQARGAVPANIMDAADQLRIVMSAEFASQPLLNRSEVRVFKELDHIVLGYNPLWQVMAQVSLGEILRTKDKAAFSCINSKRVDLLLVDEHCHPRHVVEYQGLGHHQGTAAARDAVKKEALRRAGIGYHEVVAGHTKPSDLRRLVERLVDKQTALDVSDESTRGPSEVRPSIDISSPLPEARPPA